MWCGYLDSYPNHPTQGRTLDELKYMLGDILDAIRDGDLVEILSQIVLQNIVDTDLEDVQRPCRRKFEIAAAPIL